MIWPGTSPMRASVLLLVESLAAAGPALAAQPSIEVQISPALRQEAEKSLGVRDVERLAADLKREVGRSLARTGVLDGARLELTLVDVKPNRPTFQQLGKQPSLSMESFGVGGATIEGKAIAVDGTVTPLGYRWYETDIRNSRHQTTWGDASTAIYQFARRLGRGETQPDR
jgi:hypothetical protein